MIPEYWIEGIGSTGGVLNSSIEVFGGLCGTYILLCEEENGNTIYLNPEYEQCYYLLLDDNAELEASTDSFQIIYKPVGRELELVFNDQGKRKIHISNIQGQTITRFESAENTIQLSLNGNSEGLYIVNVKYADGRYISKKLMIY